MEKQDGAGGGGCSEDRCVGRLLAGNFVSGWASPGFPHEGVEDVSSPERLSTAPGAGDLTRSGLFCFQNVLKRMREHQQQLGPTTGSRGTAPRRAVSTGGQALWWRL